MFSCCKLLWFSLFGTQTHIPRLLVLNIKTVSLAFIAFIQYGQTVLCFHVFCLYHLQLSNGWRKELYFLQRDVQNPQIQSISQTTHPTRDFKPLPGNLIATRGHHASLHYSKSNLMPWKSINSFDRHCWEAAEQENRQRYQVANSCSAKICLGLYVGSSEWNRMILME